MKFSTLKTQYAVTLIGVLFLMTNAQAQDTTAYHKDHVTNWISVHAGYAFMQNDALNQFLAYNAPELNNNMGVLGLSGLMEYKRWIGGLTLQGGMTRPVTVNDYAGNNGQDYQLTSGFYNGLIHLGYAVVNTPMVKIFAILGVGGGRASARLLRTNINQAQIVNNNAPQNNTIEIGKSMAYFDLGLGIDFFNRMRPMEGMKTRDQGGVLGLRIGFTQGIGLGNWGYNGENNVSENPTYNPGMFYAKLVVGIFKTRRAGMRY